MISSSNGYHADQILQEVIARKDEIRTAPLKKALLLKFISTIYTECITKRKESKKNPFHLILYEYFFNKYGLKKTVERKLKQVYSLKILKIGLIRLWKQDIFIDKIQINLNCSIDL